VAPFFRFLLYSFVGLIVSKSRIRLISPSPCRNRYGAEADEIWSVDEALLSQLEKDGVELPVLDVGIAHGEKARGGAY
jgi:hypothetical protein